MGRNGEVPNQGVPVTGAPTESDASPDRNPGAGEASDAGVVAGVEEDTTAAEEPEVVEAEPEVEEDPWANMEGVGGIITLSDVDSDLDEDANIATMVAAFGLNVIPTLPPATLGPARSSRAAQRARLFPQTREISASMGPFSPTP